MACMAAVTTARKCLSHAREGVGDTSDRERDHVDLVGAIIEGRIRDALSAVEVHANRYPRDVVAIAPALGAYGLFAFSGRADHDAARLAFVERLAPHFPDGFPWLLAHRGWCRVECGALDEGLAMVLEAIAERPANGHNAHMVAHAYYEKGDPVVRAGLSRLLDAVLSGPGAHVGSPAVALGSH